MAYPQGAIVIAEDPFGNNPKRPYLILSNDHVPFYGQEYVAVVMFRKSQTNRFGVNHRLVISSVPESRNTNRGQDGFHQES